MNYPLIASGLSEKRLSSFETAVSLVEASLESGRIANPDYVYIKDILNRCIDNSWKKLITEKFIYGNRENLPRDVIDFYDSLSITPYLHTLAGMQKKLQKTKLSHPLISTVRAFLDEAVPLAEKFEKLKTMVVKRQPKPVEDQKAKYNAPEASLGAIGQVKELLTKLTDEAYVDLVSTFVDYFNRLLEGYLKAQKVSIANGEYLPIYKHFKNNPNAANIVSRFILDDKTYNPNREYFPLPKNQLDEKIQKLAVNEANQIREMFIYKNLKKIDSIVEAKGNFERGEIIGRKIEMNSLRGTLRFFFTDGSSFVVQNSVVWSHSIYGKAFNRFPLTFHDVIMPDGSKMPRPSEERMNTVFVGKQLYKIEK